MHKQTTQQLPAVHIFAAVVAACLISLTLLNWIGWKFDIYQFRSVGKSLSTMKANTALAFLTCGVWILLRLRHRSFLWERLLALFVLLIGGLTLLQYVFSVSLGIDELLFTDTITQFPRPPGRMGTNTATGFLLTGIALLFLSGNSRKGVIVGQLVLVPVFLLAFVSLLGYAYSIKQVYGIVSFTSMAAHTTCGFLFLVPALCTVTPRIGVARLISRTDQSRLLSRMFLPALLILPLLVGYLGLHGEEAGLFAPEIGLSLMVSVFTAISFLITLIAIGLINRQAQLTKRTTRAHRKQAALLREREVTQIAEKARAEFLAMVSHDIRTPLNGILGLADLLQDTKLDPRQRGWVRTLQGSGQILMTLVNDFLDFSRLEAGRFTFTSEPFEVESTLADLISLYSGMAEPRNIQLRIETSVTQRWLLGDAVRIRQIVGNLLSNAIKFTEKGSVTILHEVKQTDASAELRISIIDSGSGMSEETRASLFQPYTKTDHSRSGGAGLGLAISKSLARAMGGDLELVRSDKSGTEFRFHINLPMASKPREIMPTETRQEKIIRVLVAEDNEVNQTVIQGYLKKLGITPVFANNGQEAFQKLETAKYDLVFMDVNMPVLGGIEATARIRTKPFGEHVPIIALTANAFSEDIRKCKDAGMNDFLTKPVRLPELDAMIKKWTTPSDGGESH